MPKTFRLREQLTRSYDTLLGDLKSRDEDVLHRKHAGENDADFDGLEPEEDFKVPLQRDQRKQQREQREQQREQREPLDLVKQKQTAKKPPFFAPGESPVPVVAPLMWMMVCGDDVSIIRQCEVCGLPMQAFQIASCTYCRYGLMSVLTIQCIGKPIYCSSLCLTTRLIVN